MNRLETYTMNLVVNLLETYYHEPRMHSLYYPKDSEEMGAHRDMSHKKNNYEDK